MLYVARYMSEIQDRHKSLMFYSFLLLLKYFKHNKPTTSWILSYMVLTSPAKYWIFSWNSRTCKVLENNFGPGKSWKLRFQVLERPGNISLKVVHLSC